MKVTIVTCAAVALVLPLMACVNVAPAKASAEPFSGAVWLPMWMSPSKASDTAGCRK